MEPSIDYHPLSDDEFDEGCNEGPSLHKLQREANASAWENVRAKLLHAIVESEAMPLNQVCTKCSEVAATLRCRKCGPSAFFLLCMLSPCPLWNQRVSCCRGVEG